jgi:hypothetical protein
METKKQDLWEVYINLTAIRKRDRKAKRHLDVIEKLTEAPDADKMNELERKAKTYIQTHFKEFQNTFKLEALHFTVEDQGGYLSKTRMLFGEEGDVKQVCMF